MKRYLVPGIIVFVLVVALMNGCSTYNSMVGKDEAVKKAWADVETQYQARLDKTANLFEIVTSAADFEKQTLTQITEARAKATSVQMEVNPENLTPENIEKFKEAQAAYSSALGRLLAVAENYPTLKSVDAFRDFQAQYEGMENRIATARSRFNEAVLDYNSYIRRFPPKMWAGLFGFDQKTPFEAEAGAEKAPSIKNMKKDAEK